MEHQGNTITSFDVKHLPLITAMAQRLGLVEEFDKRLQGSMQISPGRVVLAMVIDALSGRSPLFRLHEFYETHDTDLLLGEAIDPHQLSDWNLGRVLDRIFDYGTNALLTAIAVKGLAIAKITESMAHFDTTSVRVWGNFNFEENDPFWLTQGFSKDKRPDLKQFVLSLLTVKGGLPVRFSCESGNENDKTINSTVLDKISQYFAVNGLPTLRAYVADSAMVTQTNLILLGKVPFISRLPAVYDECDRVIREAVAADAWTELGIMAETKPSPHRPQASYRATETKVTLYGQPYRAIVYHSSAHDARRQKRISKEIKADYQTLEKQCRELEKQTFFCQPDALAAVGRLVQGQYHHVETTIVPCPVYPRGRAPKGRQRQPTAVRYAVATVIVDDEAAQAVKMLEAGCFVLIASNIPAADAPESMDARGVLQTYKEQYAVEQGFRFLKDPMILDSLFLKTPHRIEALGLILIIALFIWRLIQYLLRLKITQTAKPVEGWQGKATKKPTTFMMMTKFISVSIITINSVRYLNNPLTEAQKQYLDCLELPEDIFLAFPSNQSPPVSRA